MKKKYSAEEINKLIEKAQQTGEKAYYEELYNATHNLILYVLNKKFSNKKDMENDLYQTVCARFKNIINNFDLKRKTNFSTYFCVSTVNTINAYLIQHDAKAGKEISLSSFRFNARGEKIYLEESLEDNQCSLEEDWVNELDKQKYLEEIDFFVSKSNEVYKHLYNKMLGYKRVKTKKEYDSLEKLAEECGIKVSSFRMAKIKLISTIKLFLAENIPFNVERFAKQKNVDGKIVNWAFNVLKINSHKENLIISSIQNGETVRKTFEKMNERESLCSVIQKRIRIKKNVNMIIDVYKEEKEKNKNCNVDSKLYKIAFERAKLEQK